jgi:hypothetical protein
MEDAMPDPEEQEGARPRPRVVDKRVSARGEAGAPPAARAEPPPVEPAATAPEEPTGPLPPDAGEAAPAEGLWTPEQEEQARRLAQEVLETPSGEWVVNAAVTLANVAATKLEGGRAADAQLCIDALAGIIDSVGPRLGDVHAALRQTLAQLQMAFAQGAAPPRAQG